MGNNSEGNSTMKHSIRMFSFIWPPVDDYLIKQREKEKSEQERELQRLDNCSNVMRKLTGDTKCWQTLPPSWIEGNTLLMLAGLVNNVDGTLVKGAVKLGDNPIGCNDSCKRRDSHLMESKWNSETVLHRAFCCPKYRRERAEIKVLMNKAINESKDEGNSTGGETYFHKPWTKDNAMRTTLYNKRYSQSVLRTLTKIAFNRQTWN